MVWCEGGLIPRVVSVLVFFDIKARSWNFWHALHCVLYDGDGGLTSLRCTEQYIRTAEQDLESDLNSTFEMHMHMVCLFLVESESSYHGILSGWLEACAWQSAKA
jgi:hypothetical protein